MSKLNLPRRTWYFYNEDWQELKKIFNYGSKDPRGQKEIAEISKKLLSALKSKARGPLNEKAAEIKLVKIFSMRKDQKEWNAIDEFYGNEIVKKNSNKKTIVKMIGICHQAFFAHGAVHRDIIKKAIENDIYFQIILLNPCSEAGKSRISAEEPDRKVDEGNEAITQSRLFRDISNVADELKNPTRMRSDLKQKFRSQIEVRFTSQPLTNYLIITRDHTFIENYHSGITHGILGESDEEGEQIVLGGYVPYYVYENSSSYAKIMKTHFDNLFKSEDSLTLDQVRKEISNWRHQRL